MTLYALLFFCHVAEKERDFSCFPTRFYCESEGRERKGREGGRREGGNRDRDREIERDREREEEEKEKREKATLFILASAIGAQNRKAQTTTTRHESGDAFILNS